MKAGEWRRRYSLRLQETAMKVFLLSDLVVHEMVSMQLEGKWLTSEQFAESARLWVSRNKLKDKLSEEFLGVMQCEAIQIAKRLMQDVGTEGEESALKPLLLHLLAVDCADPLSASALAASLEVCRAKLCDCFSRCAEQAEAQARHATECLCPPVLRLLLCGIPRTQDS
jgi:hypothetical protein